MLPMYELSKAIQADREREIQQQLRMRGLTSGRRHPGTPDAGVVVTLPSRPEPRRAPRPGFGV